jgi:hypothetical protein
MALWGMQCSINPHYVTQNMGIPRAFSSSSTHHHSLADAALMALQSILLTSLHGLYAILESLGLNDDNV